MVTTLDNFIKAKDPSQFDKIEWKNLHYKIARNRENKIWLAPPINNISVTEIQIFKDLLGINTAKEIYQFIAKLPIANIYIFDNQFEYCPEFPSFGALQYALKQAYEIYLKRGQFKISIF